MNVGVVIELLATQTPLTHVNSGEGLVDARQVMGAVGGRAVGLEGGRVPAIGLLVMLQETG